MIFHEFKTSTVHLQLHTNLTLRQHAPGAVIPPIFGPPRDDGRLNDHGYGPAVVLFRAVDLVCLVEL